MNFFELTSGEEPIVATAIHNGHGVRPEIDRLLAIDPLQRLREEDPYTAELIDWAPTRLIGCRSRFEVDLNRPREQAVYRTADQAWGLDVWHKLPDENLLAHSLANYDAFYAVAEALLRELTAVHGRVIVLDVHSYNHRRDGVDGPLADAATHPEINVGTGTMERSRWTPVVDGFISALSACECRGRRLDVRENVKFFGGHFCRWIHRTFPHSVCALAVEFKKTFMDEWTGELDRAAFLELKSALQSTTPRLLEILRKLPREASAARSRV